MIRAFLIATFGAALLCGQQIALPPALEKELTAKAKEVTEVTLDSTMLQFARQALSSKDPEQNAARKIIDRLKGIYIRVYEFDGDNAYSFSQLEPLRAQLNQGAWKRIVNVRQIKGGENVEVYIRTENNVTAGLTVIAGESDELAVIHIDGPLDLSELGSLSGQFGIPDVGSALTPAPKPGTAKTPRNQEEER